MADPAPQLLWYTVYPPVATVPQFPHIVVARFSRSLVGVGEASAETASTAAMMVEVNFMVKDFEEDNK